MSDAKDIIEHACRLGLRLQLEGGRIAVAPARLCPPSLLATLREHKPAVMALLEAKTDNLTPDCAPWLHVARQVLAGEFDGADRSFVESLIIGLRSIPHPRCRQALALLRSQQSKSTTP
jgi:hypothetical protein